MILYMKTTTDEYELPIAVADSAAELAEMVGISRESLYCMVSRGSKAYHKVEVDDWTDNTACSATSEQNRANTDLTDTKE